MPISMVLGGLHNITWSLGIELTISLLFVFRRRWGLYFWLCVLQSWVLYSRLHLLMPGAPALGVIKYLLAFNSVILVLPGLVISIVSQARPSDHQLAHIYMIWGRVQLVAFLIQETALCTLYMHLTLVNILIIVLDIASLAIMLANLFYLQAAVNSCVHAVKLKVEFSILNRLRDLVSHHTAPDLYIANEAAVVESSLPVRERSLYFGECIAC
ncbi:hypothetical protein BJX65DRAFT_292024 [Aspergillus insuetus]